MKKIISIVMIIALLLSVTACNTNDSVEVKTDEKAEQPKVVFKAAWHEPLDPDSHPASLFMNVFKEEVEKGGVNMTVELYPSGQLGDAASQLKQTQDGIIQFGTSINKGLFVSNYGIKDYYMLDLPYLFSDYDDVLKVLTQSKTFQELIEETAQKTGVRQLFFYCEGFRSTTNNVRPLHSPDDFKGIKIRVMQNEAHMKMMEALGAIPTPISYSELYTSLQTGVVEGQENPPLNIYLQKFYEIQDYLILDRHVASASGCFVNEEFYQSLTPEQKAVFDAAGEKAAAMATERAKIDNTEALKKLEEEGMTIYIPTEDELAQFRAATVDELSDFFMKEMDNPERLGMFLEEVNEILGR